MSAHRTRWARCVAISFASAAIAHASLAPAQTSSDAHTAAERYQEGVRLLQDHKLAEAIAAFDASLALQMSPNTALVKAHALRLLGRRVEALAVYEDVVRTAGDRVGGGDDKLRDTLADAGRWIALLHAELGEVSVDVAHAVDGTTIAIDGAPVTAKRDADAMHARVWHEPGHASVVVRTPSGEEKTASSDVTAGKAAAVRIEFPAPAVVAPPEAPKPAASSGPPTASFVAWGVGAVGLGAFAVFGTMAKSASSDLDACSPKCTQDFTSVADRGRRDETIANVALVVAGAGIVTGAAIWIFSGKEPAKSSPSASIAVVPTGTALTLRGVF